MGAIVMIPQEILQWRNSKMGLFGAKPRGVTVVTTAAVLAV
jgi:hypothetical protein